MNPTIPKYLQAINIVRITEKIFKHLTFLNHDKSSPIKQINEIEGRFAGCVSSWPDGRTYKHIYYAIVLQG